MSYLLFEQFVTLNEGGNAFKTTSKFNNEDKSLVRERIEEILSKTKMVDGWEIVGSFDTKPQVNDVDVVVTSSKFSFDSLDATYKNLDILKKDLNYEMRVSKTIGVLSILTTINKKKIQIDLLPVPSLEWGTFSYSATSASKHKALYRNALLEAIAKGCKYDIEYYTEKDATEYLPEGSIKSYWRYRYLRNAGLWKVKEVNQGKRVFRYEKERATYSYVTSDPKEVVKILLGKNAQAHNFKTYESVFNKIINSNYIYYDNLTEILENFKIVIVDRQGNRLPAECKELMKYLSLKISQ